MWLDTTFSHANRGVLPSANTTSRPAETASTALPVALPRAVLAAFAALWVAVVDRLIVLLCATVVDSTWPAALVTTTKSPP